MKKEVVDPAQDGVSHIRVNPHGRTKLGRLLASCALTPIIIPGWGAWNSIDAFLVGLGTGDLRRVVRELSLDRAAREAFYLSAESKANVERQMELVQLAFECKLDQTKVGDITLREALAQNKLSLTNYHVIMDEAADEELPAYLINYLRKTSSKPARAKTAAKKAPVRCLRRRTPAKIALA